LSPLGNFSGEAKVQSNCDRTANPRYAHSAQIKKKRLTADYHQSPSAGMNRGFHALTGATRFSDADFA
jgi:hypothetical protein